MSFSIGESVGHYEIVEELGIGGSGRVLKVQHLITRRREAMKILADNKPDSPEQAQRFLREIRLQASLDHPNIAAVLNAFWLEDDLVMIMELLDGHSLATLLENRRFSVEQGLKIIRQVLLALGHAHRNGVIHRDVSPANIVVNTDGRVKLTDFGLAKGKSEPSLTELGGMYGSPFYISPEQVRGTANVDHRSDIYSSAVVLYELLTGTRPFIAASSFLLMQAHVQQVPEPPIYRNAALPQFLNAAILKALAKNPDDRFQTAEEFLAAIDGPQKPAAAPSALRSPLPASPLAASPAPVSHPVEAVPSEAPTYSYSFAEPLPYEPIEFESRIDKPMRSAAAKGAAPPSALRSLRSPTIALGFGLGIAIGVIVPFLYFKNSMAPQAEERPVAPASVEQRPAMKKSVDAEAIALPSGAELTPGPKEVLVPGARVGSVRSGARRNAGKGAAAPVVQVWGAATSGSNAHTPPVATNAPANATPVRPAAVKLEEPPAIPPVKAESSVPALPQGAVLPSAQAQAPAPERRGFFRRLARGVKSLNPIKREGSGEGFSSPAVQTSGSGSRP